MPTFHVNTTLKDDGEVKITGLPFVAGEKVEVIIRSKQKKAQIQQTLSFARPFVYLS